MSLKRTILILAAVAICGFLAVGLTCVSVVVYLASSDVDVQFSVSPDGRSRIEWVTTARGVTHYDDTVVFFVAAGRGNGTRCLLCSVRLMVDVKPIWLSNESVIVNGSGAFGQGGAVIDGVSIAWR